MPKNKIIDFNHCAFTNGHFEFESNACGGKIDF